MKRLAILALLLAGCGADAADAITPGPHLLATLAGTGTQTSAPFDAPNQWTISWSFDCSAKGSPGTFFVSVGDDSHGDITPPPVQPPMSIQSSGNAIVYKSGRLHLGVTADAGCSWGVAAHV